MINYNELFALKRTFINELFAPMGIYIYRLRTHLNNTTDGKIFVAFIALILRSYIANNLPKLRFDLKNLT